MDYYISNTTTNSVFAILLHPVQRFVVTSRLFTATRFAEKPARVALPIYSVINGALGYTELWNKIGISSSKLLQYRQAIHNITEGLSAGRPWNSLLDMCELINFLNRKLSILGLLINDRELKGCILSLVMPQETEAKLEKLYTEACTTVLSKHLCPVIVPGIDRPLLAKCPNILTSKEVATLADNLREDENQDYVTDLYSQYLGGLDKNALCQIDIKRFITGFFEGNPVADDIIVKMHLSKHDISTIMKLKEEV